MSLIEIDTGAIFSGYLDYGIMYKTRSIAMESKNLRSLPSKDHNGLNRSYI